MLLENITSYNRKVYSFCIKITNLFFLKAIKLIFDRVTIGLPQIGSDHPIAQNSSQIANECCSSYTL